LPCDFIGEEAGSVAIEGLVDRLATHRLLSSAPREQLAWISSHARERHFSRGELAASEGQPLDTLWIVLSGHLSIRVHRGGEPRKVTEWREGDVTGVLPYSRLLRAPGNVIAEEPTEMVVVSQDDFPEMIRECHELTAILVHEMLDRARHFTSSDLQVEKLASLGKLAAGLAHELNNPASAVARSAQVLAECVAEVEAAGRALGTADLSDAQLAAVDRFGERCRQHAAQMALSPVERADREDALAEWLRHHGADAAVAESLADSGVSVDELEALTGVLNGRALGVVLRWVVTVCTTRKLALEIESAATQIHNLVKAVKGFTYMDQSTAPAPVDVGQGLADTLVVLGAKARKRKVHISLTADPSLPRVEGFGGELNQVWHNLIDNALDAVPESGHVTVTASQAGPSVIVQVVDDGPGIPPELRNRIFDPFFTTKSIGEGTGLGLDIVQRLVRRHGGEIEVESQPGRTEFRVTLPLSGFSQ
jgi:signal transduction histidine kinase